MPKGIAKKPLFDLITKVAIANNNNFQDAKSCFLFLHENGQLLCH